MPYIMNALNEKVSTQAHGKYFTWAPGEIKLLHNEKLAAFLSQYRGEEGLVEVSEATMELDKNSEEFKETIREKRREGIEKFVRKQHFIIRNLELSLRRDYETSGQKGDYRFEASKGELQAYKNLKAYKDFSQEHKLNTAEEIAQIQKELNGNSGNSDSGTSGT